MERAREHVIMGPDLQRVVLANHQREPGNLEDPCPRKPHFDMPSPGVQGVFFADVLLTLLMCRIKW